MIKRVWKMDMLQLRSSAELMDTITFIALAVAGLSLVSAGVTTWMSVRYHRAVDVRESAIDLGHNAKLADEAALLEKEVASERERRAQLESSFAEANEKVAAADKRADELEKTTHGAVARAADLEKELAEARTQIAEKAAAVEQPKEAVAERQPQADEQDPKHRQIVETLRRFAGTQAAIYAVGEAPDAAEAASSINDVLTEAGWASMVWVWAGVGGMVGVGIITKEGIDAAIDSAATELVGALNAAGFNSAKANWPKEMDWRRLRGSFSGPQSPAPTDAAIRIVIGTRWRH